MKFTDGPAPTPTPQRQAAEEIHRETAIDALQMMKGDNLARARHAFHGMSPKELSEQYGQSGCTRAQILSEYEAHAAKIDAAIAWVSSAS